VILTFTANDPARTSLAVVNGTTVTGYGLRGDADWGDAVWDLKFGGPRGTQGARAVFAQPQNRPVALTIEVDGAGSKDTLAQRISTLASITRLMLRFGGTILIQFDGQTRRQYLQVLAGTFKLAEWGIGADVANMAACTFQAICAPYLLGDPLDISDGFDSDTITAGDWTQDTGGGTLSVSGGLLVPSSTATKRYFHTGRGYSPADVQVTCKFTTGASVASTTIGVVAKRIDASNYIRLLVSGGFLAIAKVVAGAGTNLATAAQALAANTSYWTRLRIQGNVLIAECWTTPPTPGGTPASTCNYALTAAEAATFGESVGGPAGLVWIPTATDERADDFTVEPYTYAGLTLPDDIRLTGAIPGDAPALADITVTPTGGAAAPAWAWLAWSETPKTFNRCWNGDFEVNTNGWYATGQAGVTGAATSITRVTAAGKFKYGVAGGEIVTPATANTGAVFAMYAEDGYFRKGVTYTAELYAAGVGGSTTNTRLRLGVSGDIGSETPAALTATMARRTVTWTPAADSLVAYVAFEVTAATLTTMQIDGVMVYRGTAAPALQSQSEGRGAPPPFGIRSGYVNAASPDLSGWAAVTDANYRTGAGIRVTTAGAGTASAAWPVDPALIVPDDFTQGELDVEVFARVELDGAVVSPRLTLSTIPEAGTSFGPTKYTAEYGSGGKLLAKPSSGAKFRMVRLGTLTFLVDRARPVRWKVQLAGSYAAGSTGSFGIDYLLFAPARQRACGPTGKANDSTYPKFVQSTSETSKTVKSDLSGRVKNPGSYSRFEHPDAGLGGSLLELPAAATDLTVKLSSLVPDDPTSDTTNEQLSHTAAVHVAVTPRYHLARSS